MDYAYANIVNMSPEDPVVQSFETNPLFRFIKFYSEYDDPLLDTSIPTLYVGYKEVKKRFKVDILKQQMGPTLWWCASPKEDSMRFLKGFQEFLGQIPPALVSHLEVERTDPIFGPAKSPKELLTLLRENTLSVSYLRKGVFHIYTGAEKVLVFDTRLYAVFDVDAQRLKEFVKNNSAYYYDDENDAVFHFFTNRFEYDASEASRYIPYLIWLKVRTKPLPANPTEIHSVAAN